MSDLVERVARAMLPLTLLSACGQIQEQPTAPRQTVTTRQFGPADGVSVWKDPETGCEYLKISGKGITPRYAPGGSSYERQHIKGCSYE